MTNGTLQAAYDLSLAHLAKLDQLSASATASLETLRTRLRKPVPEDGIAPEQVVRELARDVDGGILGSAGGRFFGWVIGGSVPAALATDWLTSAWDQNGALYATSPASAVVEEVVGAWLIDILGLPAKSSFALVSGCQMAHVTCLAAARHALLARRGWDVECQGLYEAPSIRILSTAERHGSCDRAIRFLGLGLDQIFHLPADDQGRLQPAALEKALAVNPSAPAIVLLQAGELNIGAYDLFEEVIPIAHRYGAWVHVDGAIGLFAAASERYRHLLKGISAADSWATDGHKWLNVPYDCGYAFVADPEAHRSAMSYRASYLPQSSDARDQMDWNPEWSRRARGFPTYAAIRQLGRAGIAELVDRCCRHAHSLVMRIGALPGAEVVWEPLINQGLVGFTNGRNTDEVIAAITSTGEAFFGGTTWRGRRAMRVSVSNWKTTDADVDRAVNAAARALGGS